MRIALFLCVITVLLQTPAYAADSPLKRAMKLYKKNQYKAAIIKLSSYLPSIKQSEKASAYLSLGMFYLSNAELHRKLYDVSVSLHLDYLKRISAVKGKDKSHIVNLYLGEAFMEADNPEQAALYFNDIIKDKQVKPHYKDIARVGLGIAYYLQGKKQMAESLWSKLKTSVDAELLSELAAAYSKLGLKENNPQSMCEKALSMANKSGKGHSMRVIKNSLGVYAQSGLVEKGLNLLKGADIKAFSHEEVLGKNKAIRFYDLSLLKDISILYSKASIEHLKKALTDSKVKDMALYYLGEAYARLGMFDESGKAVDSYVASGRVPGKLKNVAKVRKSSNLWLLGQKKEARNMLEQLAQEHKNAPYLLAEIILACSGLNIECKKAIASAIALVEAGRGKKFSRLNFALGKYYLGKQDYLNAITYMETGRDKSNKNRVEYNAPLLLVNLSEAYYYTKKFSEALEIYFEMSRQFPAVRQIQVTLQGIYSMEQKSAGDVKVF